MRSLFHFQVVIISLLLIHHHVSPISTFSTTALNNESEQAALNAAPDSSKDQGSAGPELAKAELERTPQSAESQTSDNQHEAAEQLPVPQAASVGKTAKKILGFTFTVFIVLVLIALFVLCGCAFLLIRLCCS